MSLANYQRMLPGTPSFERLRSWIRNYCDEHYSWDVQYVLARPEVPETILGRQGRLGWTTWVKTGPMPKDPDDLVITPHDLGADIAHQPMTSVERNSQSKT
jgi:type VI secretion system protein ImpH